MELSDLVGIHKLSGVETGQVSINDEFGDTQDCGFVKFTLDGVHYMAVEDPEDGYRSRCRELVVSEQAPRYSFPPPRNALLYEGRERVRRKCRRTGDAGYNDG